MTFKIARQYRSQRTRHGYWVFCNKVGWYCDSQYDAIFFFTMFREWCAKHANDVVNNMGHWYVKYEKYVLKLSQVENYLTQFQPGFIIISYQFLDFLSLFRVLLHLDSMRKYVNTQRPILMSYLSGICNCQCNSVWETQHCAHDWWCSYKERNDVQQQHYVHIAIWRYRNIFWPAMLDTKISGNAQPYSVTNFLMVICDTI